MAVPRALGAMRSLQEIYLEDNTELEARAPRPSVRVGVGFRVTKLLHRPQSRHFSTPALEQSTPLLH